MRLKVINLKSVEPHKLLQFLMEWPYRLAYRLQTIPKDKAADILGDSWLDKIHNLPMIRGLGVVSGGSLVGAAIISHLDWDSEIFSRKMASIQAFGALGEYSGRVAILSFLLEHIHKEYISTGYVSIHAKVDVVDHAAIHTLERIGYLWMDTLVVYMQKLNDIKRQASEDKYLIRLANPGDRDLLRALIHIAFKARGEEQSRFHADPHLPTDKAVQIYEKWIDSLMDEDSGATVFVAEDDRGIVGLSSYEIDEKSKRFLSVTLSSIPLSATHPQFWRKGIYTTLRTEVLHRLSRVADWAQSRTQINNPVLRRYQAMGAQFVSAYHTFHYWTS